MKRIIALFVVLGLASSIAFAYRIGWNAKKQPPVSLPSAYTLATQALGAATNEFYCIAASTLISRSQDGEWLFSFCSTNGARKDVCIFLDNKTKPQVIDGGITAF